MKDEWKTWYNNIPVPTQLDAVVDEAIAKGKKRARLRRFRAGILTPLAACAIFVLMLNINVTFAYAVYDIPVLGDLGKIFTFREYQEESNTFIADVRIPNVDVAGLTGENNWTEEINKTITETMESSVAASMKRAEEYYAAYVSTGGDPEEFHQMLIDVDYEVKYTSDHILSFIIYKMETLASGYQENYYYNIDLQTGETITLEDLLGSDYVEIIAAQVEEQLENLPEEDKGMLFTDVVDIRDVVAEDAGFYLNANGEIVVVFPKYSIGAGALGLMEFPISAEVNFN